MLFNYQKLSISFKISHPCCFGLRGNLEFTDFLQKKFYNINYRAPSLPPSLPQQPSGLIVFLYDDVLTKEAKFGVFL